MWPSKTLVHHHHCNHRLLTHTRLGSWSRPRTRVEEEERLIVSYTSLWGCAITNVLSHSDPGADIDPFCRDHPELCIGGALGSQYYSTKGVFNGSGIALAGESWNEHQRRLFTLYFQHHTGDIRFMQYTTDKKWIGGTRAQTVATDAKNATAISTVAYALNATQYVRTPKLIISD